MQRLLKRIAALMLILLLLFSFSACSDQTGNTDSPALPDKTITVLFTNDVHCAFADNLGYAAVAALKKELSTDGYVLLADAGDAIQGAPIGTVSTGSYAIDLMNYVGYDVATPGNHEFDYGMERFLELAETANFPFLSANFTDLQSGEPVLDTYVIKEIGGVKLGFVGISTPRTITSSTPAYFQNEQGEFIYGFCADESGEALYNAVQAAVDAAREAGADYVIALSHLGIEASCTPWMSTDVIANTTGIDAVLDGHSHSVLECEKVQNKEGESVILSSTGTGLVNIGQLQIDTAGNISCTLISECAEPDADTASYIQDIYAQFDEQFNTVIAHTDVHLIINDPATDVRIIRTAETNLGDLCADAYRTVGQADIGLVNGGGIRTDIAPGDITYNTLVSVFPFGNELCVVEATGQEILDALELGARAVPTESGGFLQVSGLSYEIHTYIDSSVQLDENGMFLSVDGEYRVKNVQVAGQALDLEKTYTVASHNYLVKNCGDGYTMFADNNLLQDSFMLDYQVLIEYITKTLNGNVGEPYTNPYGNERIIAVDTAAE